eukprot:9590888-Heterocapsa_arctica.AAC.1
MVQTRGDSGISQDKYIMFEDLGNKVYAIKPENIYRKHKRNKPHKEEDIVECIMATGFIWQNTDKSYSGHAYNREDKHCLLYTSDAADE